MPFKSQAQRRYMYATNPKLAKRFEEHTPKGKKLPEYVMDKVSAHCTSKAKNKKKHTKIAAYEFILENHPLWIKEARVKNPFYATPRTDGLRGIQERGLKTKNQKLTAYLKDMLKDVKGVSVKPAA